VTKFAAIIGTSLIMIPYTSHKKTPVVNKVYIPSEMLSVFFSLIVFIACGKKEIVVKTAASIPMIAIILTPFHISRKSPYPIYRIEAIIN